MEVPAEPMAILGIGRSNFFLIRCEDVRLMCLMCLMSLRGAGMCGWIEGGSCFLVR